MKTTKIIFCFLCTLLIIASLHHLNLHSKHTNKNTELNKILIENNNSNQILIKQVNQLNEQIHNLRNVSAGKIIENRKVAATSNNLGKSASQLVEILQNKILEHKYIENKIKTELNKKLKQNKLNKPNLYDKQLLNSLPPFSEQPYLLIEPQK